MLGTKKKELFPVKNNSILINISTTITSNHFCKMRQALEDFLSNTSFHGLLRIFHPVSSQRCSKLFRGIWLLAWISALSIMVKQINDMFNDYHQFNTLSKTSVKHEQSVQFPTVTICSAAPLSKAKVDIFLKDCNCSSAKGTICEYFFYYEEICRQYGISEDACLGLDKDGLSDNYLKIAKILGYELQVRTYL